MIPDLTPVELVRGHTRRVDPGIARLITAGHITDLWCHTCTSDQPTNLQETP